MLSEITKIFGVPIHSYGLLIMIGFLCGLFVASRRAKQIGLPAGFMTDLGVYAIVAGMLGAKGLYLLEHRADFRWGVLNLFDGNLALPGGLIGAALGAVLYLVFRSATPAAGRTEQRRQKRRLLIGLLVVAIVGGVIGARADGVRPRSVTVNEVTQDKRVIDPSDGRSYDLRPFEQFGSGFVFYGGILPAIAVVWIMLKVRKAPVLLLFDILAPSLMLGLAFGRLGCHLNGCCFGQVCSEDSSLRPFAIQFPKYVNAPSNNPDNIGILSPPYLEHYGGSLATAKLSKPVLASQLLMSLDAFGLFWILTWYARKRRRPGGSLILVGLLYPVARFLEEMTRADPVALAGGLRISQWISLGILAVAIPAAVWFWRPRRRDAEPEDRPAG